MGARRPTSKDNRPIMATAISIAAEMNRDREALSVWSKLPQQREIYPDFERLLHALPYSSKRHIDVGASIDAAYIHLAVPRGGFKGLCIRLKKASASPGPDQLTFLRDKAEEGYFAGVCFGWEQARDVIVHYMALGGGVGRLSRTVRIH
jgi:hypothetical protein